MTLEELIDWVDDAMLRLPSQLAARNRAKHLRRLYRTLDLAGADWELRKDWHALALKIAKLVGDDHPPMPDSPGDLHGRERKVPEITHPKPARGSRTKSRGGQPQKAKRRRATPPPREPIQMNARLQAAFDAVAAGRPIVFVTGGAGTGKSTFIRELRSRFPEKNAVVLAPTGIAALTAGGQTIHSFCKLPLRPVLPEDAKADDENGELIKALDLVIIDEVSMVRADVLDGVDAFLRKNRQSKEAFGGVQLVLVGDLFQLPPVVTRGDEPEIRARYETPQFFSANCLRGLRFFPVELQIVYRQRDAAFASLLAGLREGDGVSEAVRQLNEACVGRELTGHHVTLMPTRLAAAAENEARLEALTGNARTYDALLDGTFASAGEDRLPAPKTLALKAGAQVMFVRNDYPEKRWVNGTIGAVVALRSGEADVRLDDGSLVTVSAIEWQDVRYALDEKKQVVEEVVGTYRQLPLIPAWAVTIHKAQGLTLSRVVVDLDRGAFAEGQVYVALSRCQTLEGLSLRRPVRVSEVRCSEEARAFHQRIRRRPAGSGG